MPRFLTNFRLFVLLATCLISASFAAEPPVIPPEWAVQGKPNVHKKLGAELPRLQRDYLEYLSKPAPAGKKPFKPASGLTQVIDGYVVVDAVATRNANTLRADLLALGAIDIAIHKSIVSARVPITALDRMGKLASLKFADPSFATVWAGSTTSQGDVAQRSNAARTSFSVDGTGVTVGVLSNSYDCAAAAAGDVTSGDLPSGVNLLQDNCPNPDEGRAMMQIIHDVAPGAALAFHTAIGGQAAFANGISSLVAAGANIIVDDVFYFGEPMFQDGVIAQAVDAAVASGVAYFSAAGNSAVASYEGEFIDSGVTGPNTGTLHDFDPGPGTVTAQPLTVPIDTTFTLVLQWNQPFFAVSGAPGAATDIDIFLTASNGSTILARSERSNIGNDPVEAFEFTNDGSLPQGTDTTFFLKIENFRGPDPDLIKYTLTDTGGGVTIDQFDTEDGTSYGHSGAAGAMSTGAAAYSETPAFGTNPPLLEPFSSRGNVPIYFQTDGTAINPPDLRLKPAVVAPDRVNNTFFGNDSDGDGFPNFGGTSAAAPHAAGAAALLLDFNSTLTPAQIYSALADSTINMLSSGFDFDSGSGLIQADAAISRLSNTPPQLTAIGGREVAAGGSTNIPLSSNDVDGPNPSLSAPVIPGFCSLTNNGNGNGNINCSPNTSHVGRHAVVVTATDSGSPARSDSKGFYVVVTGTATNSAPILNAIGNQSVEENSTLNVPLSASDPNGNGMTLTQSGMPAFCSLSDNSNGTGNISCNPLTGNAGTYPTTVTVTDNGSPNLTDFETFNIVVSAPVVNQAPALAVITNQSVAENASLAIPLSATDPDGNGMTLSQSGMPTFCSLSDNLNGTGNINCNPGFDDAGSYPVIVTVTDNGTPILSDSRSFTLTVADTNQAPALSAITNQSVAENASLSILLNATDADGDAMVLSQSGMPTFCSLSDNLNGTGGINCNPGLADAGSYPITVTVTDNGTPVLTDSKSFTLTVTDTNQAPALAVIANQSVAENASLSIPLNATDADGDAMVLSQSGMPTFCSLSDNSNGTGSISCNPGVADTGTYPVTVTVTDNGTPVLTDSKSFTLTVTDTNQAPALAAIANQSVAENASLVIPLNATDPDGDAMVLSQSGMPTFCSFADNTNGTGSISCNPGLSNAGTYPITVTVTDNGTPVLTDSKSFTLSVTDTNQAPALAAITNQSVAENAGLSIPLSATDPDGNGMTLSQSGMPTFCSLSDNLNGTGSISCNPGLSNAGTYPITVTVTDNGTPVLTDSKSFTLTVTDTNQAPALSAITNQSVAESASLSIPLSATDPDGNGMTLSQTGLPTFCSLSDNLNGTGSISCNPGLSNAGTYPITVTVTDNGTPVLTDSKSFTLTVTNTNQAPALAAITNQSVAENASLSIPLNATDADGNGMTLSQSGLPTFCSLSDNSNGTGSISCNPGLSNAGTYPITVTVTDNGTPVLADSKSFTLTVTDTNQAPALSAITNQSVAESASLSIPLIATDPDGNGMTLSQTGLPTFCSLSDNLNGTGSISCNPGLADTGSYPITVTVTDNGTPVLTDSKSFTLTVTDTNQAPALAAITNQSVAESASLSIPLSATDPDGDGMTLSQTGLPTFCSLSDNLNGTGSISCNPGLADTGTYPITVTVTDDGTPVLTNSRSFTLTVTDTNQAPALSAITNQSVAENASLSIPLNATDADGDAMVLSQSGMPTFCSLTDNLNGAGSISCNPGLSNAGSYPITVTVTDNGTPVLTDSKSFTLTVTDTNQAPVLSLIGSQSVAEGATLVVPISASDPDNNGMTLSQTGLPTFCSLSDNLNGTGSISCNPLTGDAGTHTSTVTVTDNGSPNLSDSTTFTIVVIAVATNQAPVLALIANQGVDETANLVIPLSATDADGNSLAFSHSGLPTFCSLSDNLNGTGSISCNPGLADAGSYFITVTVTDNGTPNLSDSQNFGLTVIDTNQAPVLALIANQSIAENTSLVISLSAADADGNNLAFSSAGLPTFCSLSDNLNGTGSISCNPLPGDAGTYTNTVTVTDNGTPVLADSRSFTLTVTDTNQAPVLTTITNQSVAENTSLVIALSATDSDGDSMTMSQSGLPVFCSLIDNLNGTGSISCNPGLADAGSYSITVTVTDNGTPNLSDSQNFSLTVFDANQAPVLAVIANQIVDENAGMVISLSATDADGNNLVFSSAGLPAFCSRTDNLNGTGNISCNPGLADAGSYSITVTVTDDGTPNLSDSQNFSLTVINTNQAPALSAIANQSVAENASLVIPLSASDVDGDGLAFSASGLPTFCSLSDNLNGTGRISCNPGLADAGNYPITVTVTDNAPPVLTDSQSFTLKITDTNQAPVLDLIGDQSGDEGVTQVVPLLASDFDSDGMTFSQSGLPGFCSLTDNLNGTGNITCNPLTGTAGTYPTTVTVTDNGTPNLSDSETFAIVVNAVSTNQSPVLAAIANESVDENASLVIPLSATDADGDSMTLSQSGLPGFCSLTDNLNGTGNITCNPLTGSAGTYPTTVTVTDNGTPNQTDSETFTIVVNALATNQSPVLTPIGNQSVDENGALVVPISASDPNGDGMTLSQTGLPVFCVLTDNTDGTGSISCNPRSLDAATYRITVTVTDDGTPNLSDSEILNIVIRERSITFNASGGGASSWWMITMMLVLVLGRRLRAAQASPLAWVSTRSLIKTGRS